MIQLKKIAEQLEEAVDNKALSGYFWQKRKQRKQEVIQLLHKVGIKHHTLCLASYPHELTEPICQRVMIAIAIAKKTFIINC